MKIQIGDQVTYHSYRGIRTGIVEKLSRDGEVVFLTNNRWLHRQSVLSVGRAIDLTEGI